MKKVILFGLLIALILSACSTSRQKLSPRANLNLKSANVYYSQKDDEASLNKALDKYNLVLGEFPLQITALKRTADIYFYRATQKEPQVNEKNGVKEYSRLDTASEAVKLYTITYGKYDSVLTVLNTFSDLKEDERLMKRDATKKKDGSWVRIFKIGQAFYDNKDYANAIMTFELANKLDPTKVEPLKMLVATYEDKKDEAKASEYLGKVLQLTPNDPGIINMMGAKYYNNKDYTNALVYFKKIMESSPLDTNNLLLIADCYASLKDYQSSLDIIVKVLKLQPDNLDVLSSAKQLAINLKDKDASITYMKKIVALDPSINNLQEYCYMMNQYEMYDGLMDFAERWYDKDPTSENAARMCYIIAEKIGRQDLYKKYMSIYDSLIK